MTDSCIIERSGPVARIVLNRPEHGNAINIALAEQLRDAAAMLSTDSAVRCVVLAGAGRLFCGGGDVATLGHLRDDPGRLFRGVTDTLHRAIVTLVTMPKPFVTSIQGPAAGAGLSLALLGDFVLAARSAHFTAAYTAIGLTPDGGLSWLLPRLIGHRRAQDLIFSNRRLDAEEAVAIGLVTRVVDDQALAHETSVLAQRLAQSPTAALARARALLLEAPMRRFDEHLDAEAACLAEMIDRPEFLRGVSTYMAKQSKTSRRKASDIVGLQAD